MNDTIATHTYVQIHEFYKSRTKHANENELWLFRLKNRCADRKMSLPESACLLLLFQSSGCSQFSKFVQLGGVGLRRMFPAMPSYANMLRGLRMIEAFILDFMNSLLAEPGDRLSIYALDSTKIDSHKAKNWPKSLRREARAGFTHEGVFFGFKLHLLCNMKGQVVAVDLTAGSTHDLSPVKGGMLRHIKGVVLGDSGYVSGQAAQELRGRDVALVAKPRPEMHDELWLFKKVWAKIYRSRQVVEGVFNVLKNSYGLLSRSVRCAAALRSRVWASLAAYCLRKQAS